MAEIRPFRGLRYQAEAGPLDALVAPPHDALTPAERDGYAARNSRNVVHLTVPEARPDDRSKFIKYARSAALLTAWRKEGVLLPEDVPAIYRYNQTFGGSTRSNPTQRVSFIALLKVQPYADGVVLPQEVGSVSAREDRLRLLEATRAQFEPIFGLTEDPDGTLFGTVRDAFGSGEVDAHTDDGVTHSLAAVTDPGTIERIVTLMRDRKVLIVDGQDRYEAALAFREAQGERTEPIAEDFVPFAISSISDPDLILQPMHRIVSKAGSLTRTQILERLATEFDLQETHSSRLLSLMERQAASGVRAMGLATEGGRGYVLTPKNDAALVASVAGEGSPPLKGLSATILQRVILEKLLGITGTENVHPTRDAGEAIRMADQGAAASFLLLPPTLDTLKTIAFSGERIPSKSVAYSPRLLPGLVFWSLADFQP